MSFLGVFSKSFGVLKSNIALLVPVLLLNYALAAFIEPLFADQAAGLFFEAVNAPVAYVPFQQLPFYTVSQNPDAFNAFVVLALINLAAGAFVTGMFTSSVKEKSPIKGFSLAFKRLGGILALAFLTSFIYLLYAVLAWALISFTATIGGLAGLLLALASGLILLALFAELQVRLFLSVPSLIFEKKTASDALGKSNTFGKTGFWKILATLAVLYVLVSAAGAAEDSLVGWLSFQETPQFLDELVAGLVGAAITAYFLIVPAVYYTENRLG